MMAGSGGGPGAGAGALWTGPALLVPVSVDARIFTTLSTSTGPGSPLWSWLTPNYAFAPLFLPVTQLFEPSPPLLIDPAGDTTSTTGVMLRWALPDGLTAGGSADAQTGAVAFPVIPNRWLIVRRVAGVSGPGTAWILASDYLGDAGGTSYYAGGAPTSLGKCWPLADWPGEAALPPGLNPPLTAVGLGDPTFAAYVPNVQHVLAFYDPLTDVSTGELCYTVCGWYAGQATDPLSGWQAAGQWTELMSGLGWSLGGDLTATVTGGITQTSGAAEAAAQAWATAHGYATDAGTPRSVLPSRTICHGLVCGVNWQGPGGPELTGMPTADPNNKATEPGIVFAHTAVDALATQVAGSSGTLDVQLAEVLTALLGGLLPVLDQPDSGAQLASKLQDTWFQRVPGGTRWEVVTPGTPGDATAAPATPLTDEQAALLDALNAAQRTLDAAGRHLASLQWDVYALWWKLSYVNAQNPVPLANASQVIGPLLAAKEQAAAQAVSDRQAGQAQRDDARQALTAVLGPLLLQQVPEPPFLRPSDPVAMVLAVGRSLAHGEDGRFTEDDGLYCRFTGQTLASLLVADTAAPVTAQTLGLPQVSVPDGPAELGDLLTEAFLLDTGNAAAIAAAAGPGAAQASVVAAQQTLIWSTAADPTLDQQTVAQDAGLNSAYGPVAVPSKIAVGYWAPPWSPLYVDWQATYYPTGGAGWTFPAASPATPLDAQTAAWTGTPPNENTGVPLQGRALLTPQASDALAARLELLNAQAGDTPELQPYQADIAEAVGYLVGASVLSQALSGFNDLLLQRDPTLVQQPDQATLGTWLTPPGGPAYTPSAAPSPDSAVPFSPLRAGFLRLDKLWVVDDFGRCYDVTATVNATPPLGFETVGPDLTPSLGPGWLALRPRLTQPSRLLLQFTDAASGTLVVGQSAAANPVCGWLIPNRVDNSLLVYDADGVLLGELLLAQAQALWLPSPDLSLPGSQTAAPDLAGHPYLAALVGGVLDATSPATALSDLLAAIEAASWATAPFGPDSAQLAALIGFPVAVCRARLLLELAGDPATSQRWADTLLDNDGGVGQLRFPVQLGSASLDDDGVVGYLADADPGHLSSPYGPSAGGYVTASALPLGIGQQNAVTVTLLLHPHGAAHAFTGILPPVSATLPPRFQLAPVRATEVTFRAGPLLTPPTSVTVPLPAFGQGEWAWLQYDGTARPALPRALSPADTLARLPDTPPGLREGWLRLTLGGQPTQLRYALSPPALPVGASGPPAGGLTLTAYNASGNPVSCDSITVVLPTGTDDAALTASPGLVTATSGQPDTAGVQAVAGQPGTFAITPVPPATAIAVAQGATLTFTFGGIAVNPLPGISSVVLHEATSQPPSQVTLTLERFRSLP